MIRLIAITPLPYATRRMLPGDVFTARSRADARALIALGKAKKEDGAEPVAKPKPARRRKSKKA